MTVDRDGLRAAFLGTDVHLWRGRDHLVVEPREPNTTDGVFPTGVATVHVITAWNPGGRRTDPAVNAQAERAQRAELAELHLTVWDAEGWAPDDRWAEASAAVLDADEAAMLALARRYGQSAIYRWTPDHRAVVWCDGRPDDLQGWALRSVASR
jgi:hypothetical protein